MNNMQGAADDIKKLAKFMKNLVVFADELERVGSLDQASREAEARIEAAEEKEKAAVKSLDVALQELASAKDAAEQAVAEAKEIADGILLAAKKKSEAIITEASAKAIEITDEADSERRSLLVAIADLKDKRIDASNELKDVEAKLGAMKFELEQLKAKLGV